MTIEAGSEKPSDLGIGSEWRGDALRQIRGLAAALARDVWGRGPERCEVHWAGPDVLVILFHGGLTASESNLKRGGDLDEVARSRDNFRHAIESPLKGLVGEITGRAVQAAIGASRLDPDLTIETLVLAPVEARRHSRPSQDLPAAALTEIASASAVRAQAEQAMRRAEALRRESEATLEPREHRDSESD